MENLLEYLWKVNCLIVLFFACYYLFLKKETYFAYNRLFLISGLFVSLILPVISFTKIVWIERQSQSTNALFSDANQLMINPQTNTNIFDWATSLLFLYAIIFIFLIFQILKEYYQYRQIIKGQKTTIDNGIRTIFTNNDVSPFSFFQTIVYNPNLYSKRELCAIIAHEKVHVKQFHSFDVLISRIFLAIFWYNPCVWFYKKSIIQNLEYIADNEAIKQMPSKTDYQYTLLKFTTNMSCVAISNHFYQSLIKKRIVMLNKKPSQKINRWKLTIVLPMMAIFIYQFQTKIVAQEIVRTETAENRPKEFRLLITKNSTDAFFKSESEKLKEEYAVDVQFSNIKRNRNNQITRIKIDFKDNQGTNSQHETDDSNAIEDFVLHCKKQSDGWSINFYTKKFQNGKEVSLTTNSHSDTNDETSNKAYAAEISEMPSPPSAPSPPTPPSPPNPPRNLYKIKYPTFNAPKAPAIPRNLNDPKVAESFGKQMKAFEAKMEAESKRFDAEQEKMNENQDSNMAEYDQKMQVFDKQMQDFDLKMQDFDKEMQNFDQKMAVWQLQTNTNNGSQKKNESRTIIIKKKIEKRENKSN